MTQTITLRLSSKPFEGDDDCLAAACESIREQIGLDGTVRVDAAWADDANREEILLSVPATAIYDAIEIGSASPSTTGVDDGLDLDVTVCGVSGEVTLCPSDYDGRFGSWGERDHWVSGRKPHRRGDLVSRVWILGASDPEMDAIEQLLRECGETVVYATVAGARVHSGNAYSVDCTWRDPGDPGEWDDIITVECEPTTRATHRIDHHRPGDPGFGRPPSEFMTASSIGQVIAELARLGRLPETWAREDAPEGHDADRGLIRAWHGVDRCYTCTTVVACAYGETGGDYGGDGGTLAIVPQHLVLTAAADHCLGAAYRGECPGVDPDALAQFRAEQRARFQGRPVAEVLADIEATTVALGDAERIALASIDAHGVCRGCGVKCQATEDDASWDYCECPSVADMRREPPYPELPEAATRLGIGYISGPLVTPDGRRKLTCSGSAEHVRAFLDSWAPREGLVDCYGDSARGFAGGYLPEKKKEDDK